MHLMEMYTFFCLSMQMCVWVCVALTLISAVGFVCSPLIEDFPLPDIFTTF